MDLLYPDQETNTMATTPPAAPVQPSSKGKPLFWILGGCAVIIFLGGIAVVGGLMYLKSKGPAYLITKVITASNPNLDVVSVDSNTNKVTVRDKSTGKTYTVNFEDAKKGKLVLQEDGKDAVTVTASGQGDAGTVEFKSADGNVKIGGDAKIPAWIPQYPGSQPKGTFSAQSNEGTSGTYAFKTSDAPDKVSKFYEDNFKSAGLEVNSNLTSENGKTSAGVLSAHDKSDDHTAAIVIGTDGSETTVAVTFKFKK
jgi:hypothetical protein